ncbi:MAG TPA: hypothetical protein IAB85_06900 [Candidatus Coprenecus merdigallinarum]|nr:hypothetical protein [Candidatus Coprenecus merdigallinarum]
MKKNLIKTGAIAAAIILAASCGSGNGDGNLISVNFNRVDKGPVTNISELAGEPEFIALDSRVEAFATGYNYAFSDHYICIGASMRGPAKLYDRATGKFLCDVGTIGRGPGEYLNTYGAPRIDEEDGTIWLLPWQTKTLLGFDIATGKFKKEVPLKYGVPKGQFSVDSKAGTVTVAALPFRDLVPMIAWQQDMQGNVLWEIPSGHLTLTPDFSNEIESNGNAEGAFDLSLITWSGGSDSLYVINEGRLDPVYTIDFNTKEVESEDYNLNVNEDAPIHSYIMLPDRFITSVSYPVQTEWGFSTGKPEYVITDRRTGESVRTTFFNDYLARETDYASFTGGYWYTVTDPETFAEDAEKALKEGNLSDENKARIQEILKDLTPESNNIVILAPLK